MLPNYKRLREKNEVSQTGVSVQHREPDTQDDSAAMEACAVSILMAIASKDHKALSEALQDVMCIHDSQKGEY